MSIDTPHSREVARFDEKRGLRGPVTNRLLKSRGLAGLAGVWVAGLLLVALPGSTAWDAVGLGLMFPGGGFLLAGHPLLFVATVLMFGAAMVLWFVLSPVLPPPSVWLPAAGVAGGLAGGETWPWASIVIPALLPAGVLLVLGYQRVLLPREQAGAAARNRLLAIFTFPATGAGFVYDAAPELSQEDLSFQRFLFDLALQSFDSFEGLSSVDQFRESAYRYQLNYAGWALALASFTRTPAFSGYSTVAQRQLIEKMVHPRIWSYWYWENMLGNLELNPDPIRRDNIMFSGYLGVHIAAFEAATGDRTFSQPGALCFDWKGKRKFVYDFHSVVHRVFEQMDQAAYCAFPCEPNWIYPVCNSIAMGGLVGHDTQHGTDYGDQLVDRYRRSLENEYTTPSGKPVPVRSNRLGFSFPGLDKSTMNEGFLPIWINPYLPDIAARTWAVSRAELMSITNDGLVDFKFQSVADRLDFGTYRPGFGAQSCAMISLAAAEMGDYELRDAILARMAHEAPPVTRHGATRYAVSTTANAPAAMGRLGQHDAWRHMLSVGYPESRRRGPRLSEAAYPDVLVSRAVTDGDDLALVLRPGNQGSRVQLGVDQLRPATAYRATGCVDRTLSSDAEGRGTLQVDLSGRAEVTLSPLAQ